MARTTGPLMSFEASGSIAKTLTFSRWKGRPYVRSLVTPANPKSPLQVSTRAIMRFLSQNWALDVDFSTQALWDDLAAQGSYSPFNAYTKFNLKAWTQFLAPMITPVGDRNDVLPTFTTTPTATGGVRQISVSWDVNVMNDVWGLLIFASDAGPPTPARDNLVLATNLLDNDTGTAVITPLQPGVYDLNFETFTVQGRKGPALGNQNVTVT